MLIERQIEGVLKKKLKTGKVVILLGARRVGKTFLLNHLMKSGGEKYLYLNGEDFAVHDLLRRRSIQNYKNLIGDKRLLFIDEAQKVPDIGLVLKLMIDELKELKVLATGSSAFDLLNITGEPLTGRKSTLYLFPLSESELTQTETVIGRKDNLGLRLVYGNYPELITIKNLNDKADYLRDLINSYLLKDILAFEQIKNSSKVFDLLRLIAFQIGKQVSYYELGRQLSISKSTVEKYLNLLSKTYIIHKLGGFSKNLRKEIVKSSKWYFYDNGIRNAVIANFSQLNNRNDVGELWENYIISERIKYQNYSQMISNNYYWRTYDKQKIDWIEEREGQLFAYEMKWRTDKSKIPVAWKKAYPDAQFQIINSENFYNWLEI